MDNEFCINLDRVWIGRAGWGMSIDEVDTSVGKYGALESRHV